MTAARKNGTNLKIRKCVLRMWRKNVRAFVFYNPQSRSVTWLILWLRYAKCV